MPSNTNKKEEFLNEFLEYILTKCMRTLEAKSGSIFLFDEESEELVLNTVCNGQNTAFEGTRQALGEGIAGLVALNRRAVLVEDINRDSLFFQRRRFNHYQTDSFLSVPLEFQGELIGVINITERDSKEPFNKQDLKFLLELCSFIAFSVYQFKKYGPNDTAENAAFSLSNKLAIGLIHDLNSPLDGIIRYINLSLERLNDDGVIREYLLEAKQGLNRVVTIIRSLLDYSRTTSSTQGDIDINKTLNESLSLMNHYFLSGKITVAKRFDQHLPLVPDHGLKLVFTNLLKNACEAIGSGEGTIALMTEMRNGFVDVYIADSGPGIPGEIKDRIFEPFITTKEMGKGTGLGLAICSNIIEKYGGCILLESEPGKGATFTIRIPRKQISSS